MTRNSLGCLWVTPKAEYLLNRVLLLARSAQRYIRIQRLRYFRSLAANVACRRIAALLYRSTR